MREAKNLGIPLRLSSANSTSTPSKQSLIGTEHNKSSPASHTVARSSVARLVDHEGHVAVTLGADHHHSCRCHHHHHHRSAEHRCSTSHDHQVISLTKVFFLVVALHLHTKLLARMRFPNMLFENGNCKTSIAWSVVFLPTYL